MGLGSASDASLGLLMFIGDPYFCRFWCKKNRTKSAALETQLLVETVQDGRQLLRAHATEDRDQHLRLHLGLVEGYIWIQMVDVYIVSVCMCAYDIMILLYMLLCQSTPSNLTAKGWSFLWSPWLISGWWMTAHWYSSHCHSSVGQNLVINFWT